RGTPAANRPATARRRRPETGAARPRCRPRRRAAIGGRAEFRVQGPWIVVVDVKRCESGWKITGAVSAMESFDQRVEPALAAAGRLVRGLNFGSSPRPGFAVSHNLKEQLF